METFSGRTPQCVAHPADVRSAARVLQLYPGVGAGLAERVRQGGSKNALRRFLRHYRARSATVRASLAGLARLFAKIDAAKVNPEAATKLVVEHYLGFSKAGSQLGPEARRDLRHSTRLAASYRNLGTMLDELDVAASDPFGGESSRAMRRNAITVATIHASKGGERPVVFLVGAVEGGLPLKLTSGTVDNDEEQRLAYVAVTRAMRRLYVSWPASAGPLSRFFAEPAVRKRFRCLRHPS